LKKTNGYSRSVHFKNQEGTLNAVKRLVYRYFLVLILELYKYMLGIVFIVFDRRVQDFNLLLSFY
jgi:hypothetical protein